MTSDEPGEDHELSLKLTTSEGVFSTQTFGRKKASRDKRRNTDRQHGCVSELSSLRRVGNSKLFNCTTKYRIRIQPY
jgi:hypothetical protein